MAEAPDVTVGGAKGLDFLKQKVGPLPLGVWLAIGVGLILYFKSRQAATAKATAGSNQQTDPAGNVGVIDPATGYVQGSPEDQASLSSQNAGSDAGNAGQNSTSGGQKYADNNTWGIAAINLLVGLGVDATTANQAVGLYLASQPLSTAQQGDVNLAIQALGPPPSLPGPTTGTPPPVVTPPPPPTTPPPPGNPKTAPPPTGLVVSAKSGHSARIKWNKAGGATGYTVKCTDIASKKVMGEANVSSATLTYAFGNLQASHSYVFDVWSLPRASGNGPHAEASTTLPRS